MSHPYCGKRRYILFTIHISVYIKYWYVMLCLIQTLNLFNTYLHLRCPVIHPRCHYCISSLDGLGKGANWRTIGQLGHGTFPNFITFGLLSQNTMSHNEIVFFLTDISLHWLWLTQLFQKVDRQVEQSIWTLYFPCKNHSLNDWHIKLQV